MNFKQFKQLQYINPDDYKYKGNEILLLQLADIVKSKKTMLKRLSNNNDIESLFLIFIHGITKTFLFLLGLIISKLVIPLYYFIRLLKLIIVNKTIYSFIIFPFAIIFDLINRYQAWNALYRSEDFTLSEKTKIEYQQKFKSSNDYVIWDIFWR